MIHHNFLTDSMDMQPGPWRNEPQAVLNLAKLFMYPMHPA